MSRDMLSLLALDVGAGTTDILFWSEDFLPANCPRMVVSSATELIGRRINDLAGKGESIHLGGRLMGGGSSTRAIRDAIRAGVSVSANPNAALTINDNLDKVREMGVIIREEPPPDATTVVMQDVDLEAVREAAKPWDIEVPENVAVAVQDHGHSPKGSNRLFRFKHWKGILDDGGRIEHIYTPEPPHYMTRMLSVRNQVPGALVIDTGPAAILGALDDTEIARAVASDGAAVINFGNAHTIAFLIRGDWLFGLFEHHTRSLDTQKLEKLVQKLQNGEITNEEIFDNGGHGAAYINDFKPGGFNYIAATGPKREMARGLAHFAAPHGDMMLTGCFGLVRAWKNLENKGT